MHAPGIQRNFKAVHAAFTLVLPDASIENTVTDATQRHQTNTSYATDIRFISQ